VVIKSNVSQELFDKYYSPPFLLFIFLNHTILQRKRYVVTTTKQRITKEEKRFFL
jgi:amino acid permease